MTSCVRGRLRLRSQVATHIVTVQEENSGPDVSRQFLIVADRFSQSVAGP